MATTDTRKRFSRRSVLKVATAAGAIVAFPTVHSFASNTHTRKSLQGTNVTKDLENYKIAVRKMLALPPDDPRNWYRIAFTHLLDCPHGNWWFLVWHRGYLGWLERTCRELCGDPTFALPYWDWTKETAIPSAFWDDVLNPNAPEYEANLNSFEGKFRKPLEKYWNSLDRHQIQQQMTRGSLHGYANFHGFWQNAMSEFFPRGQTRTRTRSKPELPGWVEATVREQVIKTILAPKTFTKIGNIPGFESSVTSNHHLGSSDASTLEGQPHNNVHVGIGGNMGGFLSPVDPIFFMHHANIDRLWDVWTRKQQATGLPIGPVGNANSAYNAEQLLFFSDIDGAPASKTTAGNYFEIGDFAYDYEAGTGEDVVRPITVASATVSSFTSTTTSKKFGIGRAAKVTVPVPKALTGILAASFDRDDFARITFLPPHTSEALVYDVYLSGKGQSIDLTLDSSNYAGSFTFFGKNHKPHVPATFTLAVTEAMNRLRISGSLSPGREIDVALSASTVSGAVPTAAPIAGTLTTVQIGAF